jgi:cell wall-associated NlpC family hydrolase
VRYTISHTSTRRRAVQHRRRTGPAALLRALGALALCGALAGTALAAVGGTARDPAATVLQVAGQQVGDPYVWGGTGPDSWDCSGLTSRLWREVGGVTGMPRVASDQQTWAVPIPVGQLLVGDLVFFGKPASHVALYAGNGRIVDASSSQRGVIERTLWTGGVITYGRVPRPGMPPVIPWTPVATAAPSPAATRSPAAGPSPTAAAVPSRPAAVKPSTRPSVAPTVSARPAALVPLRGLSAPTLQALSTMTARIAGNAKSVQGAPGWTDLNLVRVAWHHAGGGDLPRTRAAIAVLGQAIPLSAARVGDLVVYGQPANHLGVYLGYGYMVDAPSGQGRVAVRRVYADPTVRVVRVPVVSRTG